MISALERTFKRWGALAALAAAMSVAVAGYAAAQQYPERPINVLVGFGAGGASDVLARKISEGLQQEVGQPVVVRNNPGVFGNYALSLVADAQPDGYTIGAIARYFTANLFLYPSEYDPIEDFEPITLVSTYPMILLVRDDNPAENLEQFVERASASPGAVNFGVAGVPGRIAMSMLADYADITFTPIAYNGDAELYAALLRGEVDAMMAASLTALGRLRDEGGLRALAVTTGERTSLLPDVPAIAETYEGYADDNWFAFVAPKGTPAAVIEYLHEKISAATAKPEVMEWLLSAGLDRAEIGPAEFADFIASDVEKQETIIRTYNISGQ